MKPHRGPTWVTTTALLIILAGGLSFRPVAAPAASLEAGFAKPPQDARPWVYWFWLNGNITREGITADLEAMKRVGIGGVLIMEVDQGAPVGPVDFMSERWRELFKHVHKEARRLGLKVNLNNDAGWNGSGGPWIKPEQSMQKVVWSETNVSGPLHLEAVLPQPDTKAGFYRDISVLAFTNAGAYRIPHIKSKSGLELGPVSPAGPTNLENVIERSRVLDISHKMDPKAHLVWDVPEGEWTVLRFGHTSTGVENAPAPKSGRGLECDKLRVGGIDANFEGMMAKLCEDTGVKGKTATSGLTATHIDSWENGSQNWTPRMREEFWERRGYDPGPLLPVLTGRVVDNIELSERFLWDVRRTISELVIENYAGRMRELAHARGLRFTVEAYGAPCDSLPYAGQSDEPMGEFWSPSGYMESCKGMASAAHIYGKRIVGAEAFTAGDHERWREHPATLKALGDQAFCEGINRFVFHRYALQPWKEKRRPGMTMGPWGQHYERTATWWAETPPWHEYLARCQYMLRQGLFVADICYLQNEAPPQGPSSHPKHGYDWDECCAEVVLTRMSVRDGRLVLPDGMSYRLLALPQTTTMTPALLRKLKDLIAAGATIVGAPPDKSPSLSGYPRCDEEVKQLAAEVWGDCDGMRVKEHRLGLGRVVRGVAPEQVLSDSGLARDLWSAQPLRWIHRATTNAELYFVANPSRSASTVVASFRVPHKLPELWWPETGRMEPAAVFQPRNGCTSVLLPLGPAGSVFVVFRKPLLREDAVVSVTRNGEPLLSARPEAGPAVTIQSATYGVPDDPARTRDVRGKVQAKIDSGEYDISVRSMADGDDPAYGVSKTLTVTYLLQGREYTLKGPDDATLHLGNRPLTIQVLKATYGVPGDPQRTRDVRLKLQRLFDAGETTFTVNRMAAGDDPAYHVIKTLVAECLVEGKPVTITGTDPETLDLSPPATASELVARVLRGKSGTTQFEAWQGGAYELRTASGRSFKPQLQPAAGPVEVTGPWTVSFPIKTDAPLQVTFATLSSWSEHASPDVKYFSGTAVYRKTFQVPRASLGKSKRLYLDLGEVQAMARLSVNKRDLGLLWKAPFLADITDAARPGENRLEVQVVNLWPNRLIGDEQLAEDSERNPNGTLKAWPPWLLGGKPSPTGRSTFTTWRLWKKDDSLLRSGLLGPVRLLSSQVITVDAR